MKSLHIDSRLRAAADYATSGGLLADIGTDHAYLPCWLILNNISRAALACDINKGPLSKAEKTISECKLSDRVKTVLCDGLSGVCEYKNDINDIVIAGMGGELIAKILSGASWTQNERYNLIFQPMTKADFLREYLCGNGYKIIDEAAVVAANKHYTVINARFDGEKHSCDMIYRYCGELVHKNDEWAVGYKFMIAKKLEKIGCGLISGGDELKGKSYLCCSEKILESIKK